jgi:hypothetical protein
VARRPRVQCAGDGDGDGLAFPGHQFDPAHPQLLTYGARFHAVPRRHRERDFAHRLTGAGGLPQLLAIGQTAIVCGAHQPVGGRAQLLRPQHQGHQIRFAVGHIDQSRSRQTLCHLGDAFIALDPAQAFLRATTDAGLVFLFARPHPRIE